MSERSPDLFDAVRRVVAALDELGVPYFVCGSVASMVFGEPRLTIDADVVAHLEEGQATQLVDLLGRYLERGLLCRGFARLRCAACGYERLVTFSCRGKLCPSCLARRSGDTAAWPFHCGDLDLYPRSAMFTQ